MSSRCLFATLWLGLGLCWSAADLAAQEIKPEQLPKQVKATLLKRYPKGTLTGVGQEKGDDANVFHISLTNEKKVIEIAVQENGEVRWISISVAAEKLPKPVTAAVQKKYPQSKVTLASEVYNVRDGKDVLEYFDLELTTKADVKRFLNVELDGMISVDEAVEKK